MTTFLLAAAFGAAAFLLRYAVIAAARRAARWEDECRSRLRDRQWAAVEPAWSQDLRRT